MVQGVSRGARAPEPEGFSSFMACGILVLDQVDLNSESLVTGGFLTTKAPGKFPKAVLVPGNILIPP